MERCALFLVDGFEIRAYSWAVTEAKPTRAAAVDVFGYLDHRRFLDDWFRAKKNGNPRFSHRMFARLAGQKSPSLLLQVIRGDRNLTPATAEAFIGAMKLSSEEAAFFADLVKLNQASSPDEQNEAWSRISASRRFRAARRIEGQGVEYISHWYYPAVRELANRDDFEADPAWIARALRPRITASQARKALELLLSLGLLEEREDGRVRSGDASIVTPHEVAGLAARNYHRGMLELARDSVETATREERHLAAVTVCIPQRLVPRLKREINAIQERLLDLCDGAEGEPEQVYQVHLALFPLSEPLDGASS
jgi:uncharacterized protein (TIGR02147 family)